MARLFLALPLPARMKARLREEMDRLRLSSDAVSWVAEPNLHVTVRFLGEVRDEEALELHEVIEEAVAGIPPLRLVVRGFGGFPDLEGARVLWFGVDGNEPEDLEALRELRRRLDRGLRAAGFRSEKGAFQPHVTLGRVASRSGAPDVVRRMGPGLRREFGHLTVDRLTLFDSALSPRGRVYDAVQEFGLG